jgi:hypothetical protein
MSIFGGGAGATTTPSGATPSGAFIPQYGTTATALPPFAEVLREPGVERPRGPLPSEMGMGGEDPDARLKRLAAQLQIANASSGLTRQLLGAIQGPPASPVAPLRGAGPGVAPFLPTAAMFGQRRPLRLSDVLRG